MDDSLAQQSQRFAREQVDVSRDAGFDAVAVSATWQRGQRRPTRALVHVLGNVAAATRRADMQLVVVVWHGLGRDTPRTPAERADFAAYAAALVKLLPHVRAVIVGNEPNLSTFWKPQFGAGGSDLAARAYADLLARSYDAIKTARPSVQVLGGALSPRGADRPGGSRPTHSPTAFIRDLGAAYRTSGRDRPFMDAFAFHPYMEASKDSPSTRHPENTTITVADYPKLVSLLAQAFRGTAQRARACPSTTPSSASRPPCRTRSAASTPTSTRPPAPTVSPSTPRRRTTAARSSSPTASRPCAACSSSTPSTSRTSAAGSRASTSPTARRSRACPPSSAPSPTCAAAWFAAARVRAVAGQYVAYTFFRVDPAWRRLPIDERAAGKDAFAEMVEDCAGR